MRILIASLALSLLGLVPLHAEETQGLVFPIKLVSVSSPVLQEVIESVLSSNQPAKVKAVAAPGSNMKLRRLIR